MASELFAYKFGDVQGGRWNWAVGATGTLGQRLPLCVAVTNFHGSIKAGYDPETLAPMMAAAPALLKACKALLNCADTNRDWQELKEARAAIAAAEGKAEQ